MREEAAHRGKVTIYIVFPPANLASVLVFVSPGVRIQRNKNSDLEGALFPQAFAVISINVLFHLINNFIALMSRQPQHLPTTSLLSPSAGHLRSWDYGGLGFVLRSCFAVRDGGWRGT